MFLLVLRQNSRRKLSQHYGCWCLGSLCHHGICCQSIDYVEWMGACILRVTTFTACTMLILRNEGTCKYNLCSLRKQGSMAAVLDMVDAIIMAYDRSHICRNHIFQEDMNNLYSLDVTHDDATAWGRHSSRELQWRHNERDGVSNQWRLDCLLNRLFRRRSKKTSKHHVTGLCEGNSLVTGEFPAQRASYAEDVSSWWRHHGFSALLELCVPIITWWSVLYTCWNSLLRQKMFLWKFLLLNIHNI